MMLEEKELRELRTLPGAEKSLLQAAQKDPGARRAKKGVVTVRCSQAIGGNEAYGSFSATC